MKQNIRWVREIDRLLPIRSQFVLAGNVNDDHLWVEEETAQTLSLKDILWNILKSKGFVGIVHFNPVDGFSIFPNTQENKDFLESLHVKVGQFVDFKQLRTVIQKIFESSTRALVINFASRIANRANSLTDEEHVLFRFLEKFAQDMKASTNQTVGRAIYTPMFLAVNNREDLPTWFGKFEHKIAFLDINLPSYEQRLVVAKLQFSDYKMHDSFDKYMKIFADNSDNLKLKDMEDIRILMKKEKMGIEEIDDMVRSYKTGDQALDSPWRSDGLRDKIKNAQDAIKNRVKGQSPAIDHAMDILKRSIMGLNGAHASSSSMRPRGVLFLAGPTGVGKTELAKALTKSIFGNDEAYIRFDMSEFSAEQSDMRLIGAPPSYVGYEEGGQLTKAIRSRPFSLVLFDEIEKAHPRILDKFLQILEDGRLTDGQGETVYFSESILVFTTNLGIIKRSSEGPSEFIVEPGEPYEELRKKVIQSIEEYFKYELKRPEILNRLGENIIVFNFIQKEIAKEIFTLMLENIKSRILDEHGVTLNCDKVFEKLLELCTYDLSQGGRGIGSKLEIIFINPLARALFELAFKQGDEIIVNDVAQNDIIYTVSLSIKNNAIHQ